MYLVGCFVKSGVTDVLHALDQSGGGLVQTWQKVKAFAITEYTQSVLISISSMQ